MAEDACQLEVILDTGTQTVVNRGSFTSGLIFRLVVTGLLCWVLAGSAYAVLRLTSGDRPVGIHVRWAPTVDDAARFQLEQRYQLARAVPMGDRTFGYTLTDRSRDNIRNLVLDPAVEDTHEIDRTAFRVWDTAPRFSYITPTPGYARVGAPYVPAALELLVGLLGAASALAFGAALAHWIGVLDRLLGWLTRIGRRLLGWLTRIGHRLLGWLTRIGHRPSTIDSLDRPVIVHLSVGLACIVVAVFSTTFIVGSTPDEEEFRFAVLSTWLHVDALRQGRLEFWTALLGLGVPQPFTPNFVLHPLLPLLGVVSPVTWIRILLLAHTLLGAAGMWHLTRRLRASALTSAVCVSTFLLATPAQNYVLTDFWPSHFIVWTSAPWLLLLAWRVLEADGKALRAWSVACGLCAGLVIASANPAHLIVYATVVASVVIVHWQQVVARGRWIAVAALVAVAIASPTLVQLARERLMFAPDIGFSNQLAPLPWLAAWNALLSPLGPSSEPWPFTRTLFFGGPFAVLCVIGCVRFAQRHGDLAFVVATCTVLLFTSLLPLPFMSARFHLRDPLTLAAIPLAGLSLDRLLAARRWRSLAVLVVITQLGVLFASAWPAMRGTWTPDGRRAEWFRGATGAAGPVETLLTLAKPAGRMVFSPTVDDEVIAGLRLREGLGANALAYRDLSVVNGRFKGISAGTVWPDERLFYARVRAPQQLLASAAGLDVLGIRYVLANADDTVAEDLRRRGVVPKRNGTSFVLYENVDPWPHAFVLDSAAEHMPRLRLPGCANDRLLCIDLAPLAERRSTDGLLITHQNGRIDVRLSPADESRLLVVSQMFRRDWVAFTDDSPLTTGPAFGGLIGVRVPPGISSIQLRYRPALVMLATGLAWSTLVAGFAALVILRRTARRSPPGVVERSSLT